MELLKLLFQDNIITRPPRTAPTDDIVSQKVGILRIILKEENWDTENQQIYSDIIYSLNRDVVSTSRPIIADVRNPDEITAAFDWVIYQKGSSVIHMIKEPLTSKDASCQGNTDGLGQVIVNGKRKQWLVSNFIPTDSKKFEFQNFK